VETERKKRKAQQIASGNSIEYEKTYEKEICSHRLSLRPGVSQKKIREE
jgi:hypothetical protein